MKRKGIVIGLGLAAIAAVVTVSLQLSRHEDRAIERIAQLTQAHPPAAMESQLSPDAQSQNSQTQDNSQFIETLAREMAAQFGELIDDVRVQARLFQIREAVLQRYPEHGAEFFRQAIERAFPGHAAAILALMAKLEQYHEWLLAQNRTLVELPPLESTGLLWKKRYELFGDQAELIWAEERTALNEQRQQFQQTLQALNDSEAGSLDEKLFQLRNAVTENFDEKLKPLVDDRGLISQVFFSLDSVQNQLQVLPPEERQAQIDSVRRKLGYSEEQIQKLRAQDQERNQRWEVGKAYMAERQTLLAQANGAGQQAELEQLRQRYFGREAHTIRLEEQSGFYRFERPRVYGRN